MEAKVSDYVRGVAYTRENRGELELHRFTREQEEYYRELGGSSYEISRASAGVYLELETDSRSIALSGRVKLLTLHDFYAFDVLSDGELVASERLRTAARGVECEFSLKCELPEGTKRVTLRLTYSAETILRSLELDDGACVRKIERTKRMLSFGDSITQGFYASSPSRTYASRLADELDCEAVNKGIGGEVFRSELASLRDGFEPDIITVSYGTNDRRKLPREEFSASCRGFFEKLRVSYPSARIYALTPIWCVGGETGNWTLSEVGGFIRDTAETQGCRVIDGLELVPHEERLFADGLHPNDEGYRLFSDRLLCTLNL